MKFFIVSIFVLFSYVLSLSAQTDTLLIYLKNNSLEKIPISQIRKITFENVPTFVHEDTERSTNLSLKGNYPNPFQEQTTIEFELASPGSVEVIIYDSHGNLIQKLECKDCEAGKNTIHWNCLDRNNNRVPSGAYYYEVRYKNDIQTRKMIIVK